MPGATLRLATDSLTKRRPTWTSSIIIIITVGRLAAPQSCTRTLLRQIKQGMSPAFGLNGRITHSKITPRTNIQGMATTIQGTGTSTRRSPQPQPKMIMPSIRTASMPVTVPPCLRTGSG
jgi:hypothetical protein